MYIYFLPICVASCCVLQTAEIIKPIVVPQSPCNIVNKNIQNIDPSAGTLRGKKFKIIFAGFFPTYIQREKRFMITSCQLSIASYLIYFRNIIFFVCLPQGAKFRKNFSYYHMNIFSKCYFVSSTYLDTKENSMFLCSL